MFRRMELCHVGRSSQEAVASTPSLIRHCSDTCLAHVLAKRILDVKMTDLVDRLNQAKRNQ